MFIYDVTTDYDGLPEAAQAGYAVLNEAVGPDRTGDEVTGFEPFATAAGGGIEFRAYAHLPDEPMPRAARILVK